MTSEEFYILGNDFRRQGDFKRAMEAYMESIALDANSPAVEAKICSNPYMRSIAKTCIILRSVIDNKHISITLWEK